MNAKTSTTRQRIRHLAHDRMDEFDHQLLRRQVRDAILEDTILDHVAKAYAQVVVGAETARLHADTRPSLPKGTDEKPLLKQTEAVQTGLETLLNYRADEVVWQRVRQVNAKFEQWDEEGKIEDPEAAAEEIREYFDGLPSADTDIPDAGTGFY